MLIFIGIKYSAFGRRMEVCFFFFFFFFSCFLGPHLWHMEVPRLGVELELQLLAYTTAIVTPDPSRVCDLHHGSGQHWFP